MTICVTTPVTPHHRAMLEAAAPGQELRFGRDGIERAEIIIGDLGPADLAAAKNLQWFHLVWAGADRYKAADFPAGAKFTNGSGAYGVMIAEHMMACMLAMVRQLGHYEAGVKNVRIYPFKDYTAALAAAHGCEGGITMDFIQKLIDQNIPKEFLEE